MALGIPLLFSSPFNVDVGGRSGYQGGCVSYWDSQPGRRTIRAPSGPQGDLAGIGIEKLSGLLGSTCRYGSFWKDLPDMLEKVPLTWGCLWAPSNMALGAPTRRPESKRTSVALRLGGQSPQNPSVSSTPTVGLSFERKESAASCMTIYSGGQKLEYDCSPTPKPREEGQPS